MTTALATLTQKLAATLDLGDGADLMGTLKATAFKGQVTDAQMTALLIVANNYGLNPWTKEIYAFPDRNNGIVPVVGVDGWSRIINTNPQFDGMDFEQDAESCTCVIYRKDRNHPIRVTEFMVECRRDGVGPWKSHPRRMLRHKAMIQCARLAFGYSGIFDQDEAERIVESKLGIVTSDAIPLIDPQPTIDGVHAIKTVDELNAYWAEHNGKLANDLAAHDALKKACQAHKKRLAAEAAKNEATDVEVKDVATA